MLRDKNLIPLSHQHQHALALCVRLSRAVQAGDVDLAAWQAEIGQLYQHEVALHFAAEEKEVFPHAARVAGLQALVGELLVEHTVLRDSFSLAMTGGLGQSALAELGEKLAAHIRKEERQLFEAMQQNIDAEEMAAIGAALERALADASQLCSVPVVATRLRANNE